MMRGIIHGTLLLTLSMVAGACKGEPADGTGGSTAETNGSSPTDATTSSATGGELSHEICDRYLKCLAATTPDALPGAQEGFGEDGTCWEGDADAAQLCIDGCRTGLEKYHAAYPDEPMCGVCLSDDECDKDAGEFCFRGSCGTSACGNSIVEEGEVCDGQPLCHPNCLGPAECSPATGAPCSETKTCDFYYYHDNIYHADCISPPATPIQAGEDCSKGSIDFRCGPGLICMGAENLISCKSTYCCAAYCDMTMFDTCPAGSVCKFYQDAASGTTYVDEGLDYVGICVAP